MISQQDQSLRMAERERAQKNPFDEREDCGAGADAKGQRDNRYGRESRALSTLANRITNSWSKSVTLFISF